MIRISCIQKIAASDDKYREGCFSRLTNYNIYINCLEMFSEDGGNSTAIRLVTFVLFLFLVCLNATYADPYIGAEWNPTGNPIGGGPGYSDSVRHQDADYYVNTKAGLLSALSSASYGEIIYVADAVEIDMSTESQILIPGGVTLASGRGRTLGNTISWGALIYIDHPGVSHSGVDVFRTCTNSRITGLRFRGSYSEMEGGRPGTDSFHVIQYENAIALCKNSSEIDNCEFWGFSNRAVNVVAGCTTGYVHHNYIHNNQHCGMGGSLCSSAYGGGYSSTIWEANLINFCRSSHAGAGDSGASYTARYELILENSFTHVFDRHGTNEGGSPNYASADYIHHNTCRWNSWSGGGPTVNGYWCRGTPIDSIFVHDNWFYGDDSAHSYRLYTNDKVRIWNSHFTPTPPPGVAARLPVANIVTSVNSGCAPLTVTFKATGSYDPDGNIRAYYWKFGKDAYDRYTDINDSTMYTFDEIGIYRVELMVTDDHGCVGKDWVYLNVAPDNDSNYLSCWVKDRYHNSSTGYYSKQILIDDNVMWEEDIAGDEGWEHIIVNITDLLVGKDSIELAFKLACEQNNTDIIAVDMYIDDVVIYGADVQNGDFEDCEPHSPDAAHWTYSYNGSYLRGAPIAGDVRSGFRAFMLQKPYPQFEAYAGDWCKIEQKVYVTSVGFDKPPGNESGKVCSLYVPYPNPSGNGFTMNYQLLARSMASMKIYDASGRLVRTLVDEEGEVGEYQVHWDGRDDSDRALANGVYFCKFCAGDFDETMKLVILR